MKSLIFDIDGTLWDSRAIVAKGYNDYLLEIGRPDLQVDAEYLKTLFGKTMTEIADILFAELPVAERYPLLERCMEREDEVLHNDPCRVGYPKVKETLEKLIMVQALDVSDEMEHRAGNLMQNRFVIQMKRKNITLASNTCISIIYYTNKSNTPFKKLIM